MDRQTLEFLYSDAGTCVFMNPVSYDQLEVPMALVGEQAKFLDPGMQLPVESIEGQPVSVEFPEFIEVKIADTAPPSHGQTDAAWKPARLGNGVQVMVPPFVKTGDTIRLSLINMKYMDRAKAVR